MAHETVLGTIMTQECKRQLGRGEQTEQEKCLSLGLLYYARFIQAPSETFKRHHLKGLPADEWNWP